LKLYTSINPKRCKHDIAVEYANCIDPDDKTTISV